MIVHILVFVPDGINEWFRLTFVTRFIISRIYVEWYNETHLEIQIMKLSENNGVIRSCKSNDISESDIGKGARS